MTVPTRTPNAHSCTAIRWSFLIATILSAQCTDARVNIVTKDLFRKYRSPQDYVKVPQEELEADIRSTGFYHNKAKSIRGACAMILEKFGGSVPDSMESFCSFRASRAKPRTSCWASPFGKRKGLLSTRMSSE